MSNRSMKAPQNQDLLNRIVDAWPTKRWSQFNVVVAVSGGADSVALAKALCLICDCQQTDSELSKSKLIIAHYNHRLRGEASDRDEAFVQNLAAELGVRIFIGRPPASDSSRSENTLRDQRYEFLKSVARETNSRYIATAHHRDDQIETVLFRILRGTGIKGLCGIPQIRVVDDSLTIVRPMLDVDRKLIESSLRRWGQTWRMDETNRESKYARNFLRNEIMPKLRDRFESVDGSIARLSQQALETQQHLDHLCEPLFTAVEFSNNQAEIDCDALRNQHRVLLRQFLLKLFRRQAWPVSHIGFKELELLVELIRSKSDSPTFQLPGGIDCRKETSKIRLLGRTKNADRSRQER